MMRIDEIADRVRCGACGGPIDRVNLVVTQFKALWPHPTAGNVITGHGPQAVGVACDDCAEGCKPIQEVVEFRERKVVYHALSTLEKLPPEPTYQLVSHGGEQGIYCLKCGLASYHPDDVLNRYCANCHEFH